MRVRVPLSSAIAIALAIAPLAIAIGCRRDTPSEAHDYPVVKYQRDGATFEGADAHAADLAVVEIDAGPAPSTSASVGVAAIRALFSRTPTLESWLVSTTEGDGPDRAIVEKRIRARFREILDCRGEATGIGRTSVVVRFDPVTIPGLENRVVGRAHTTTTLPPKVGQCLLDLVRAEVPRGTAGSAYEIVLWL